MLNFVNPVFLWGLLAIIPLIILQFLFRQRLQKKVFPAFYFLLAASKKNKRNIKFKNYLLFLLRLIVLVSIILIFAQSFLGDNQSISGGVNNRIILIDNSASAEKLLPEIKKSALKYARSALSSGGEVFLLDHTGKKLTANWTNSLTKTETILQNIALSKYRSNPELWNLLKTLLSEKDASVFFISDGFEGSFNLLGEAPIKLKPFLNWIKVEGAEKLVNFSLIDAKIKSSPNNEENLNLQIKVANSSNQKMATDFSQITVSQDSKVLLKEKIKVPVSASKNFEFSLPKAIIDYSKNLEIKLTKDYLSWDNSLTLPVNSDKSIKLLIINGGFNSNPVEDEVFYLKNALKQNIVDKIPIISSVISPERLSADKIKDFSAFWLANTSSLESDIVTVLTRQLRDGKPVIFSVGDNVSSDIWNRQFKNLLSTDLKGLKSLVSGQELRIDRFDKRLDLWDLEDIELLQENLSQTSVKKLLLVKPQAIDGAKTIIRLENGQPLLLEKKIGKGKSIILASSIDRDWSNLCINASFVPFVQQLIRNSVIQQKVFTFKVSTPGDFLVFSRPKNTSTIKIKSSLEEKIVSGKGIALSDEHDSLFLRYFNEENLMLKEEQVLLRADLEEASLKDRSFKSDENLKSEAKSIRNFDQDLSQAFFYLIFFSLISDFLIRRFL